MTKGSRSFIFSYAHVGGWSGADKGTLISELILPLDPRGFTVHSTSEPTEEEAFCAQPRPSIARVCTKVVRCQSGCLMGDRSMVAIGQPAAPCPLAASQLDNGFRRVCNTL
jgi:hypothetical protein